LPPSMGLRPMEGGGGRAQGCPGRVPGPVGQPWARAQARAPGPWSGGAIIFHPYLYPRPGSSNNCSTRITWGGMGRVVPSLPSLELVGLVLRAGGGVAGRASKGRHVKTFPRTLSRQCGLTIEGQRHFVIVCFHGCGAAACDRTEGSSRRLALRPHRTSVVLHKWAPIGTEVQLVIFACVGEPRSEEVAPCSLGVVNEFLLPGTCASGVAQTERMKAACQGTCETFKIILKSFIACKLGRGSLITGYSRHAFQHLVIPATKWHSGFRSIIIILP
jgi:hypothetical protein